VSVEEWGGTIHTNLRSFFVGSYEVAKYMCENKDGGAIVLLIMKILM